MAASPAPAAPPDRLPSRSESPPRADRLVRAFNAPGLESSWANGMADASGLLAMPLLATAALDAAATLLAPVLLPLPLLGSSGFPVEPADPVAAPSSPRFAFCSSTLLGKEKGGSCLVR